MRILITVRELDRGGTEIAMLNFLKELNKHCKDITLLLSRKRGALLEQIPQNIKVIEIPFKKESDRYYISDDETLVDNKLQKFIKKVTRKVIRGFDKGIKKIIWKADIYNSFILKKTRPLDTEYDLAIDFYGYGIFNSKYIADSVKARNKVMWIHDERLDPISRARSEFSKYSLFYGVSKACVNAFEKRFPETKGKTNVFYNVLDRQSILAKSEEDIDKGLFDKEKLNIVSVGRLEWQKGFDIAIDSVKILKETLKDFCWYIVGGGSYYEALQTQISKLGLKDCVFLLGEKKNPYPYIKACDIYVQTSRHEGYGLTVAEARILKKPIIATKLPCIEEQIKDGTEGKLVECNEKAFAEAILELANSKALRDSYVNNMSEINFDREKDFLNFIGRWENI